MEKKRKHNQRKHNQYISLEEATKFCGYSQEYLSLRARQGKLKAEKFGRNWVTTKKWLKEYLKHIKNYENNINNVSTSFSLSELLNLSKPILKVCALILIIISIGTGVVFGYPFFEEKVIEPTGAFISNFQTQLFTGAGLLSDELKDKKMGLEENFKKTLVSLEKIPNELKSNISQNISFLNRNLSEINQRVKEIAQETKLGFKNIGKKISEQPRKTAEKFERVIIKTTEKITKGFEGTIHFVSYSIREISNSLGNGFRGIGKEMVKVGKGFEKVGKGLAKVPKAITKGFNLFSQKVVSIFKETKKGKKEIITGDEFVLKRIEEIVDEINKKGATKEQLGQVQQILEEMKEKGVPTKEIIREVSKIVQIMPEKQITKETIITKIDDKELKRLKADISDIQKWGVDIKQLQKLTQKIQSQPPQMQYISSPVYVGSSGLQVGGAATFSSLVVSGQVGVVNLGVGGSATFGYDAGDRLTVNATSNFLSPVVFENTLTVGTGSNYFRVDANGNLSIVGTLTVVGTSTASTYISDSDDSTIRKIGEEVMRSMVSIYRFGIPSQTSATSSYVRISKIIKENPFTDKPEILPGATRIYRFNIKYADDLALAEESLWRIYDIDNSTTTATFVLPRTGESGTLEEGTSYITGLIAIPTAQWQLELKLPTSGRSIRIFDIFLSAYDEIQ